MMGYDTMTSLLLFEGGQTCLVVKILVEPHRPQIQRCRREGVLPASQHVRGNPCVLSLGNINTHVHRERLSLLKRQVALAENPRRQVPVQPPVAAKSTQTPWLEKRASQAEEACVFKRELKNRPLRAQENRFSPSRLRRPMAASFPPRGERTLAKSRLALARPTRCGVGCCASVAPAMTPKSISNHELSLGA